MTGGLYEKVLSNVEKYLAGEIDRGALIDSVAGIFGDEDKQADDLAAQVFSGFVFVDEGVMTVEELDAELRQTVAEARSAA